MSNIEVQLIVEGQTEQTFVRELLGPYMASKKIFLHPALVGKPGHKGGNIRFERVKQDIINFLKQRSDTYVSTMLDYFQIDSEWPGCRQIREKLQRGTRLSAEEKAEIIEKETKRVLCDSLPMLNVKDRFVPYIQMHEID